MSQPTALERPESSGTQSEPLLRSARGVSRRSRGCIDKNGETKNYRASLATDHSLKNKVHCFNYKKPCHAVTD